MNTHVTECPYPGLRPFKYEESDIFFGREEHTDQLLEKLGEVRFISVVGLSGCGKSSLIRAGMIAALRSGYLAKAGTIWHIAEMRPGEHPFLNLTKALLKEEIFAIAWNNILKQETSEEDVFAKLHKLLQSSPFSLIEILRRMEFSSSTNLLICVDQFEEIFRFPKEQNSNEIEKFINLLLTSIQQDEVPIYVVTTMRSDFIGHCARFYELPEVMNKGQFLVPRLTPEQQQIAIEAPAGIFGGKIESSLVDCLLNEMGNNPDQLPLLQHCLMRMWPHEISQKNIDFTISLANYQKIGGLKDALSNHAEEAYNALDDTRKQEIAETMFRFITERTPDRQDRRRPMPLNAIIDVTGSSLTDIKDVIDVFRHPDRCFLIPPINELLKSDSIIDISHESLIRQWHRMNEWVEQEAKSAENYQRLEQTACLWKEGKAGLWSSPDLDVALKWKKEEMPTAEWAKRYGSNFNLAMEFLNTSAKARDEQRLQKENEQRQKLQRTRRQLTWALIGLIVAVSLAIWALWERANAERAKIETEQALILVDQAREKAELHSTSFREMVNSTFGFLAESQQNKKFLNWAKDTGTIERLTPALRFMIDLSDTMDEEERNYWRNELPTMSEEHKLELLYLLGEEVLQNSKTN